MWRDHRHSVVEGGAAVYQQNADGGLPTLGMLAIPVKGALMGRAQVQGDSAITRVRRRMSGLLVTALLSGHLALAAPPARPVLPPHSLAQLGVDRWDATSGLRASWVQDIVEAPDGKVWVATANGISRFDGRTFRHFDALTSPALPHNLITALALAHDGRIWVGLRFGGVRVIEGDVIRRDPAVAALPADLQVIDLADDGLGGVWVATPDGLWHAGGGAPRRVSAAGLPQDADIRWLVRFDDTLWVRTRQHGLWRITRGQLSQHPDVPGCQGSAVDVNATSLATSCRDGVWLWQPSTSTWRAISEEIGVGPLHLDPDGSVWFGSRRGLARWANGRVEYRGRDALLPDWRVRAVMRDRSGDLWVGTFSAGLVRLRTGVVRAVGAREGLDIEGTAAVGIAPDGDLLAGGYEGGLVKWNLLNGLVGRWTQAQGLPGPTPWAISGDVLDPTGVWVGGDAGLAWWKAGELSAIGPRGITHAQPVHLLYADPVDAGVVWVKAESGPLVALGANDALATTANDGLPPGRIRFLYRDRQGRLVAGGERGLFERVGAVWRQVRVASVPLRSLKAITQHHDGTYWIVSEADGLIRMKGRVAVAYGLDKGVPDWPAHTLHIDADGRMWLSGNDGISTFRLVDFERWVRGEITRLPFQHLGQRDGVRDRETNGWGSPSMIRWRDGSMVYPTIGGVAIVNPTALQAPTLESSSVYIDQVWAGGREALAGQFVTVAPLERSVRIRFSAVSMVFPESVDFRYRMEGLDQTWVDAGNSLEAQYPSLPPGDFTFRVQARLPGQPWVEAERPLRVRVTPRTTEAVWFRLLIGLVLLGAVAAAWQWRRRADVRHADSLARARAFLRDVIDTSPNPIVVRRSEGAPLVVNRAALWVPGLSGNEALTTSEPQEAASRRQLRALEQRVATTGEEGHINELLLHDVSGAPRWFRVVMRRDDAPGAPPVRHVIVTAVDVTGFKQAEQALIDSRDGLSRSREEARELSRKLLTAQEDERRRLAADMHDDVTQRLAGLAMLAWSACATLERPPEDARAAGEVRTIAKELEELARQVQSMARELHPPALDALGLLDALHAEVANFSERTGLPARFETTLPSLEVPPEVATALYRIVQEALRNAHTHAGASGVQVHVWRREGVVGFEVTDDGRGFVHERGRVRAGIGLSTMRERARLAGADLRIDTRPGGGTRVTVTWPSAVPGPN